MSRSVNSHPRSRSRTGLLPVIGLTGGVGTGKSIVAACFKRWGGVVISGDRIGHDVLSRSESVRRKLAHAFGDDIIRSGKVQRGVLAERAFVDDKSIRRLNAIIHPLLIRQLNEAVGAARRSRRFKAVVIDAALLAEWGVGRIKWDYLVGIWAPRHRRLGWLRKRGWADAEIRARMRRQMPWVRRRRMVDCIVKNDGSLSALERRARHCWEKMLSLYAE